MPRLGRWGRRSEATTPTRQDAEWERLTTATVGGIVVRPGDCFAAEGTIGPIHGQVERVIDVDKVMAVCFSAVCPEGERGLFPVRRMTSIITGDEFTAVTRHEPRMAPAEVGWTPEDRGQSIPLGGIDVRLYDVSGFVEHWGDDGAFGVTIDNAEYRSTLVAVIQRHPSASSDHELFCAQCKRLQPMTFILRLSGTIPGRASTKCSACGHRRSILTRGTGE